MISSSFCSFFSPFFRFSAALYLVNLIIFLTVWSTWRMGEYRMSGLRQGPCEVEHDTHWHGSELVTKCGNTNHWS